jgi:hypothetical protein
VGPAAPAAAPAAAAADGRKIIEILGDDGEILSDDDEILSDDDEGGVVDAAPAKVREWAVLSWLCKLCLV